MFLLSIHYSTLPLLLGQTPQKFRVRLPGDCVLILEGHFVAETRSMISESRKNHFTHPQYSIQSNSVLVRQEIQVKSGAHDGNNVAYRRQHVNLAE